MIAQVQSVWAELDGRRKVIAVLSAGAIAAAVFGIGRLATAPSMALLYSGLEPATAGEVVAALERHGIPFDVRDSSIYVDAPRRDQMRMALAAEGLPAAGPTGYELLDTLSGFGTTSQMFDAAYWRAKEGELARTITATANVRAARVHIANPSPQPFQRGATASASVTVTMVRGRLEGGQAQAIRYLISSAVPGLAPEAVSVIDAATGVVLASGERDLQAVDPALEPEARAEALKKNIERLLEARVGPGRAVVQVAVEADMEAQTIVERLIDPDSRIAISSEVEQSRESQSGSNPGVTVASNLPDGDAGEASRNQRDATQSRERTNFEVSETRRERVIKPGQVRRISVAVLVDGVVVPGADGTPAWAPRPAEELAQLRELVQSTIGFDAARGDTVTIQSLEFSAAAGEGTSVERVEEGFVDRHAALLAQLGVLLAIVMALVWFVLRPMMQRPERAEPGPDALAAPAAAPASEQPLLTVLAEAEPLLALPPHASTKIARLREVIASRSDESAAVLRNWIESPDTTREIAKS